MKTKIVQKDASCQAPEKEKDLKQQIEEIFLSYHHCLDEYSEMDCLKVAVKNVLDAVQETYKSSLRANVQISEREISRNLHAKYGVSL